MAGAGMFLIGLVRLIFPRLLSDNGKYILPEGIAFTVSLLDIAMNTAGFMAGPFVGLTEKLIGDNIPVAGLCFGIPGEAALTVIFFIIGLIQKDKPQGVVKRTMPAAD
jgi:hypothetical protein